MNYIDLRSDTATKPTDEMREAMARAEVGDDVYGEDPTARRLQERAAEMLGKDAALFVPSGTMGNQISVRLHIHGVKIDPERVQTNILVLDIADTGQTTAEFSTKLKQRGVLANGINAREMRMVTHKDVSRSDCEAALGAIREALKE